MNIQRKVLFVFTLVLLCSHLAPAEKMGENNKNEKTCCGIGYVYGIVFKAMGGYPSFIPFAKITLEGRRTKLCGLLGGFWFIGLPLEKTYQLTADAPGCTSETISFYLSKEKPVDRIVFVLLLDTPNR